MNDEQRRRIEQWKRDVEEQNTKEDAEAEAAGIQRTRRGHLVRCAADYRARVVAEVARLLEIVSKRGAAGLFSERTSSQWLSECGSTKRRRKASSTR